MAASEPAGWSSIMLMLTDSSHGLLQEDRIFILPTATRVIIRTVEYVSDAMRVLNHAGWGRLRL